MADFVVVPERTALVNVDLQNFIVETRPMVSGYSIASIDSPRSAGRQASL